MNNGIREWHPGQIHFDVEGSVIRIGRVFYERSLIFSVPTLASAASHRTCLQSGPGAVARSGSEPPHVFTQSSTTENLFPLPRHPATHTY